MHSEQLLATIRRSGYSDAIIIDNLRFEPEDIQYSVSLARFEGERSAMMYAQHAREQFGLDVDIFFDQFTRTYELQTIPWGRFTSIDSLRYEILETTDFEGAHVVTRPPVDMRRYTFSLQIGVYESEDLANAIANQFRESTGYRFSVNFNTRLGLFMVRLSDMITWADAVQIRRELMEMHDLDEILILTFGSQ